MKTLVGSVGEFSRTKSLLYGKVRISDFDYRFSLDPPPLAGSVIEDYQGSRNLLMLKTRAFDFCEMGLIPYIIANVSGVPLRAIPVFHYRRFRQSFVYCNTGTGISKPEDLKGRKVGVEQYVSSSNVWIRGYLSDYFSVNPLDMTWLAKSLGPFENQGSKPDNVLLIDSNANLKNMLNDGRIDVLMGPTSVGNTGPKIKQLFPNSNQLEIDYYHQTRIFPIMHTIVLWKDIVEKYPVFPRALFDAFVESKRRGDVKSPERPYEYALAKEESEWLSSLTTEQRKDLGEDPWIYSASRDSITLMTAVRYCQKEGLISTRPSIDNLFLFSE